MYNPDKYVDLSIPYYSLFEPATIKAFSIKVNGTKTHLRKATSLDKVVDVNGMVADRVAWLSEIGVGKQNLWNKAKELMKCINSLSEQGFITGCALPLSYTELESQPYELEKYTVICAFSVTEAGQAAIKEYYS